MYLEIVTPEEILFKGDVTSLAVPGINGNFEMLNNHAPIVSLLKEGFVKILGNVDKNEYTIDKFTKGENNSILLKIKSGTLEMKDNKAIILTD